MLTQAQDADAKVWVEVRVDDGSVDAPPRNIVVYIGRVHRELLQEWARIEHGEYWFMLDDVLWWREDPAPPAPAKSGWISKLVDASADQDDDEDSTPEYRTLIRQSDRARYWGYGDQLYLRLDRVYRITPLAAEYVERVVLPTLQREDNEADASDTPPAAVF